jgi:hypothetical protein
LKLVASGGSQLAALPPHQVIGTPLDAQVATRKPPVRFAYPNRRFEVAPYYSGVYSNLPSYSRPFAAAQAYHSKTYAHWKSAGRAPNAELRALALPEGVLHPRGYVQGYVYFPKLAANLRQVELSLNLVDADTGQIFAIARIPFAAPRNFGD